ncbi:VOC family protein [Candidatus Saccharibacteria bacterium]|nr:VOC family protein [Candidatus Saccharibacteria bacterium]
MIKKFWHTGVTVKDLEKAIAEYEVLGFKVAKKFEKPELHANAAIVEHPNGSALELWEWIDGTHPQVEYIKSHLAFMSDNLEEDIEKLVKQGCEIVIPKTEGVLVLYSYVRDPSGNYIEIAQEKP